MSVHLQNNKSALNYSDFVVNAITELLKVGSVVKCPFPPVVVNPLSVSVQSSGKKRLILDLWYLNFFDKKSKIKVEDAKSFLECFLARLTAWACSFDIKSGYHHIEIFEYFVFSKRCQSFCSRGLQRNLFWFVFI